MPGQMNVSVRSENERLAHIADTRDPGNAAAIALRHATGSYVIIGPKKVMEHIPEALRSSR